MTGFLDFWPVFAYTISMNITEIILGTVIGSIVTAILGGIGILLKMEFNKWYKIKIINNTVNRIY